jgi:uncharacterized protein with von Willebrand factor type A (vWA) domain
VLSVLSAFVDELRQAGLPVSLGECLDAAEALERLGAPDREALRATLLATLVKSPTHRHVFDAAFEAFFCGRTPPSVPREERGREAVASSRQQDAPGLARSWFAGATRLRDDPGEEASSLLEQVVAALYTEDAVRARVLAAEAVRRFAGIEPGRPVGGVYYLYRTLRRLDLDAATPRLADMIRALGDPYRKGPIGRRLAEEEARRRVAEFRRAIEREIRRRVVADRGHRALARSLRRPPIEEVDFLHATRDELAEMRRLLRPLARKLATRLARRRRQRRTGRLDVRATLRRSLATGGVPVDPRFVPRIAAKPELVLLADVSGSVAAFARFTLLLVHALASQFTKVRSFVFVDGVDEVTDLLAGEHDPTEALRRVATESSPVAGDGHSDYGRVLASFLERAEGVVTPATSLIVLGDARSNYHPPNAWALEALRARARHVYWLNPEPRAYWDTGDSVINAYARACDRVVECRNLRQLERFVLELG